MECPARVSEKSFLQTLSRAASVVCSNLVSKGLTARAKTAQRSSDALLLFTELDAAEAVVVRTKQRIAHCSADGRGWHRCVRQAVCCRCPAHREPPTHLENRRRS